MEAVPGNGAGVGPGSSFPLGTAPLGCKDLLCHRGILPCTGRVRTLMMLAGMVRTGRTAPADQVGEDQVTDRKESR